MKYMIISDDDQDENAVYSTLEAARSHVQWCRELNYLQRYTYQILEFTVVDIYEGKA